jgi:hypothetical protein
VFLGVLSLARLCIAISVPKLEKSRKVAEFFALFALTLGDKSADKNMFKLEQDQFWEH